MTKKFEIIVGLGYGDEGKGSTTSYLCSRAKAPLVIRFSGGHQAGHTVENESGVRHVFSSFGAGTLQGVPTFWSNFCTMYPLGFVREYQDLQSKNVKPHITFDPLVPVTTCYDVLYNQAIEKGRNNHGTVGVGVGCTYERHDTTPHKLYFKDLFYDDILKWKLANIKSYYIAKIMESSDRSLEIFRNSDFDLIEKNFLDSIKVIRALRTSGNIGITTENYIFGSLRYETYIFEGSQGILLDMDHGFFPHVTRANTTSKNAIEILKRNDKFDPRNTSVHYVTRAYATRHGLGPFSTENITDHLKEDVVDQTNKFNEWQKDFRYGCLDLELLKYSLATDMSIFPWFTLKENLYITCMDHIKEDHIKLRTATGFIEVTPMELGKHLGIHKVHTCNNKYSKFTSI